MKKSLFILLFGIANFSFSQTTITKAANDLLIGNTVNNANVVGTVDNSATGSNVTFTNTSLTSGAAITGNYLAPTATDITNYPGSTVKFSDGNGNTIYYKSTATNLEITAADNAGSVLNFINDNAIIIKFPTSFGNTYTDNARGTFSSTTASGLFKGTITTTADASGTLLLGSQTYPNILRIKTVQSYNLYQSTDTFYLFSIGTITSTIYSYYDNTRRYPLLEYTEGNISVPLLSINQSTSGAVAQANLFLGTKDISTKSKIGIYPNPAENRIFIEGDLSTNSTVKIYSLDGKLIKSVLPKNKELNVKELVPGNYILHLLNNESELQNIKLIKK